MSNKLRRVQKRLMKASGVALVPVKVRDEEGRERTEYRYPLISGVGIRANDGRPENYSKPARKPWAPKQRSTISAVAGEARKGFLRDMACNRLRADATKEQRRDAHKVKMTIKRDRRQGNVDNSVKITKNADASYRNGGSITGDGSRAKAGRA